MTSSQAKTAKHVRQIQKFIAEEIQQNYWQHYKHDVKVFRPDEEILMPPLEMLRRFSNGKDGAWSK